MALQLEFSDKALVSQRSKDLLSIKVVNPLLFKSQANNLTIAANYTVTRIEVAMPFVSEKEKQITEMISSQAKVTLVISLVIPFFFMMFMSASMDRAWSLYNLLQLIGNFLRFERVIFPPTAYSLLVLIQNMSSFSLGSNEHVQAWLRKYLIIPSQTLVSAIQQMNKAVQVLICVFVVAALVVLAKLAKWAFVKYKIIDKIKKKLTLSSIFRSQLQTYFPTCILVYEVFT